MRTRLKVRDSNIEGVGVFTLKEFRKGEIVIKTNDLKWVKINHCCKPNTELIENEDDFRDDFVALRDIKVDEEITFDYRKTKWKRFFYEGIVGDLLDSIGHCLCPECFEEVMEKRCNKCTSVDPDYPDFCNLFEEYTTGNEDFAEECYAFMDRGDDDGPVV